MRCMKGRTGCFVGGGKKGNRDGDGDESINNDDDDDENGVCGKGRDVRVMTMVPMRKEGE